jgi:pimeloyl-ACP methyl ester carboxylesterase
MATFTHMEDVSVSVPGGEINVWHRPASGESETAVLVHGLSGNSRWWRSVIEHLPRETGVVALDVRGRAGSKEAPPPYHLQTIADDIARCLDHFDVDRAVVAGYSMGAWVTALFGVAHPGRVDRLLLIDGGLPLPRKPEAEVDQIIDAVAGPSLRRLEIEFESEDAYYAHWRGHPALERHWDDSMRTALGHELVRVDDHFEVQANPEAIQVTAREMTIDPAANEAASKLEVRSQLIVVERGTTDEPGGMIPLGVAEAAAAANHQMKLQYLPELNHYTLILGKGAPALASAVVRLG